MNAYALKAPVQSFTLPAWVTVHNAEMAGAALVIVLLAGAVLRLSKGSKVPPPAPAPKKSGGGGGKLLLLAGLGGAGFWYWDTRLRHAAAAGATNAAPSPSPSPVPTVTRTVAPPAAHPGSQPGLLANLTAWMNHLTGTDWVLIVLIGSVLAFAVVRPLLKRSGD